MSMTYWQTVETRAQAEPDMALRDSFPGKFPDRPMQAGLLFSPKDVQLEGDRLVWSALSARYKRTRVGMLEDFIALCDAEDYPAAVLAYARKWGVLGICEHGMPCSHNQPRLPTGWPGVVQPACLPMLVTPLPPEERNKEGMPIRIDAPESKIRHWEPIDAWHPWSQKAKGLLGIAGHLSEGKIPRFDASPWDWVRSAPESLGTLEQQRQNKNIALSAAREQLAEELDDWISIGQVRPRISWNKTSKSWRLDLDAVSTGPNLFGLLGLYIANEVAGTEKGYAICSSCARFYRTERHPNPKNRNYCQECRGENGKQAAWRDAARDYRRRQQERSR